MKILLAACFFFNAAHLFAETVVYKYTGKHRLITHGSEYNVSHTGYLVLDFDTGRAIASILTALAP